MSVSLCVPEAHIRALCVCVYVEDEASSWKVLKNMDLDPYSQKSILKVGALIGPLLVHKMSLLLKGKTYGGSAPKSVLK